MGQLKRATIDDYSGLIPTPENARMLLRKSIQVAGTTPVVPIAAGGAGIAVWEGITHSPVPQVIQHFPGVGHAMNDVLSGTGHVVHSIENFGAIGGFKPVAIGAGAGVGYIVYRTVGKKIKNWAFKKGVKQGYIDPGRRALS